MECGFGGRGIPGAEPFSAAIVMATSLAPAATPARALCGMRGDVGSVVAIMIRAAPHVRPQGHAPNWQDAARWLFERGYRESVGRVVDEKTKELPRASLAYPDVNSEWKNPVVLRFMPVIPLSLVKGDRLLNYFSIMSTVGTPQAVAAQEMCIECLFRRTRRPSVITLH